MTSAARAALVEAPRHHPADPVEPLVELGCEHAEDVVDADDQAEPARCRGYPAALPSAVGRTGMAVQLTAVAGPCIIACRTTIGMLVRLRHLG